jgi:hypothetical protein
MTIERPMFPPRAESVDSFSLQPAINHRSGGKPSGDSRKPTDGIALLRLTGSERQTVAALLGYVAWGLEYGRTLEEMEVAALQEIERAHRSEEKSRRQALRRSQLSIVTAIKPWETQGISQSTWCRRRQQARAIRSRQLAQVRA